MYKSKKTVIGSAFSLLAVAFLAFSQSHVIASVAIGVSDYIEVAPNLYVDPLFSSDEQVSIATLASEAKERVESIYGQMVSTPNIIVSSTEKRSARFLPGPLPPGATYSLPWGQYIPIAPNGNDINVMAHELVHAEVYHRLGFIKSLRSLPVWFNEGVAMQVDYRQEKAWTYIMEGHELPSVSSLETTQQFFSGDRALNYAAAKVEVSAWLSSPSYSNLYDFIAEIRSGKDFYELYGDVDTRY